MSWSSESRTRSGVTFLAAFVAVIAFGVARAADEAGHDHGDLAHDAKTSVNDGSSEGSGDWSRESVWKGFAEHLRESGREDLIPIPDAVDDEDGDHEGHDHDTAVHDDDHGLPDFSRGDPIRGALFKLSKDFVVLDAWFEDAELAARKGEKRDRKIDGLVGKLRAQDDPYLRAYAEFYAARHALEKGETAEARAALEALVESRHFLRRGEARRMLVSAYRALDEDTLAILEVQFFLSELDPEQGADRVWANEQLVEIRTETGHEGPLHDCADRARTISERIADSEVGEPTRGEQRDVETILTKIADLLEDQANRCPQCQQKLDQKTGQCKSGCKQCGTCKAGSPSGAKGAGSKPCPNPGCSGEALAQGQPKGARPTDSPASDSKVQEGKPDSEALRDRELADKEAWGRINDRDVQASLRELWGKMPGLYRRLVSQYYTDLNDIESDESP